MNAFSKRRLPYIVGSSLIIAVLIPACTGLPATQYNVSTGQPSETTAEADEDPPVESSPTEVSGVPTASSEAVTEAAADPTTVCPEPTADTQLYVDEVNGFCLLYPDSFSLGSGLSVPSLNADVVFQKGVVSEGDMGDIYATLWVNVIGQPGAAKDYTAADYVDLVSTELPMLCEDFSRENITLSGGQPAVVWRGKRILSFRALYVNAHDTLYEVMVQPDLDPGEELTPEVELAWTTMLESLTFFPPAYSEEVLIPEEICPSATADTTLFIDRWDGYCVLVPNSFEEERGEYGVGKFVGGPELTGLSDVSYVEAIIGLQGATGETVEQLADYPHPKSATLTETTVSGYPAVFWERPQEEVPTRSAIIVANGHQYSLVVRPVDPVKYPEAIESAELVWNTFIDSFVFFEPWQ